jgi:cobyrinic acid a,c-diamide synthase
MVAMPRLVIAAPASGSGKTTVATGLMAALAGRGLRVSGHKAGPDYIDPGYHAVATGRPGRNLDPVLCGEQLMAPLFLHGAAGADIAVIEGVMGLFDGAAPGGPWGDDPGFGSTAHLAGLLSAPVVLVVDAARAGRSVAALVAGFAGFDPRTPLAGVILNRVGSGRHEHLLRAALASQGLPVLGAIRRTDAVTTPSRHLGLIPAAERYAAAVAAVAGMADLIAASCDLPALVALASTAPPITATPWDPATALAGAPTPARFHDHRDFSGIMTEKSPPSSGAGLGGAGEAGASQGGAGKGSAGGAVIALATGPAFTFGYTEQAELLAAAGAQVVPFDPLSDEVLPDGTAGLVIGGGFPEVHAGALAANEPMRREVAALAAGDAPVAAECAGLLYLARSLDGQPMCGVIGADAVMTPTLTLGYRAAVAAGDSVFARAGDRASGHEFHRTSVQNKTGDGAAWQLSTGAGEGFVRGRTVASYLHLHWAGQPAFAARFAAACGGPGREAGRCGG